MRCVMIQRGMWRVQTVSQRWSPDLGTLTQGRTVGESIMTTWWPRPGRASTHSTVETWSGATTPTHLRTHARQSTSHHIKLPATTLHCSSDCSPTEMTFSVNKQQSINCSSLTDITVVYIIWHACLSLILMYILRFNLQLNIHVFFSVIWLSCIYTLVK